MIGIYQSSAVLGVLLLVLVTLGKHQSPRSTEAMLYWPACPRCLCHWLSAEALRATDGELYLQWLPVIPVLLGMH